MYTYIYLLFSATSGKGFLLDVNSDDLTDVDVAGLEADALAEKGATASATIVSVAPPSSLSTPASGMLVFPLMGTRAAAAAAGVATVATVATATT